MKKRKNRIYRRIAVALTVALLVGQSQAFVLAEEGAGDVPQTEISSEGNQTDAPDNGNAVDGGNVENSDIGNTGNGTEQGGDTNDGVDEQKKCVCETACTEDAVNGECPVCAADYAACTGKADDAENNAPEGDGTENENGNLDGQEQCVCETKCVEDAVNGECPVCVADYATCTGKEAGIQMLVKEGVEAYADDLLFNCGDIVYKVTKDDQVEAIGHKDGKDASGDMIIPKSVEREGTLYRVTSIGENAFKGCGLTKVKIPGSVENMGSTAFALSSKLDTVMIEEGVKSIGYKAFTNCISLTKVEIPESVTSIEIGAFSQCRSLSEITLPKDVINIGGLVFWECRSLNSIIIPDGVTRINEWTFFNCNNLASVTVSENITNIDDEAFRNCENWRELRIVVSQDGKFRFPEVGENAFAGLPNPEDREEIIFVNDKNEEVTGQALIDAFQEAEGADGLDDGMWYGWSYKGSAEGKDTYTVTVNARKDNQTWTTDCDRKFALTKDDGVTFITDLNAVEAGTYALYDITDEINKMKIEGVPVEVVDAPVSVDVDYYTVTFYDIDASGNEVDYKDGDWTPQPVLKDIGRAVRPVNDPTKEGYVFDADIGWATTPGGNVAFDFAATPITAPTKVYATWKENPVPAHTYTVTFKVMKDGKEWENHGRTFGLRKKDKDFITGSQGQGEGNTCRINNVPNGTYHIYDLTGVSPDSYYSKAVDMGVTVKDGNTGVEVTVLDGDQEAGDVTYYTVTFYDGDEPYGEDTPQRPQVVLNGKTARKPDDPQGPKDPDKAGRQFEGWKTEDGGSTPYDFEQDSADYAVPTITSIYASWKENGGDNPAPGGEEPPKSGEGGDKPGGGNGSGDNGNHSNESNAASAQVTLVSEIATPQAQNTVVDNTETPAPVQTANGKEPKTGDTSYLQVYATLAMIAGLTYLLLYVLEESRGMTEREKEAFVAAFIRWGKKGGAFRKCCAVAAIFCLLAYYHTVGKRTDDGVIYKDFLKQA